MASIFIRKAPDPVKPEGLGHLAKRVIHAGLDATPMPAPMRVKIKECGGCKGREKFLDKVVPDWRHPFMH